MNDSAQHDPASPGLDTPFSRRRILQLAAATGVSAFLAACGGGLKTSPSAATGATNAPGTPSGTAGPTVAPGTPGASAPQTPGPSLGGVLHFANWPAYIDLTGKAGRIGEYKPGSSPTIEDFQKATGVQVDYEEKVLDNVHFFAGIQPQLVAGLSTGWDLIVLTDWLAAKLIAKGWVEKIDHGAVPNCVANLEDSLRNLSWDPGNDYHFTWQTGMAGIGYSASALRDGGINPPTSVADLFAIAEAHAKNVSFLTESRDTFGLTMLKLGLDPATVTLETLQQTHDAIRPLVDKGLRFADNAYLQDFADGRTWAAMVWSGDLASSGEADDKFVFPSEGVMLFSDNMLIPKGAQNATAALAMMNYCYDPQVAGRIADYIYYISPVKGAAEVVKELNKDDPLGPDLLSLLFPGPEIVAIQHPFQAPLDADTEETLNNLYLDLSGG
jgi:spermidine/putrescine transport system substrate-binding protein